MNLAKSPSLILNEYFQTHLIRLSFYKKFTIVKKILKVLFLSFGITSASFSGYLDYWTDDQLCAWMDRPPLPDNIALEIYIRNVSCEGTLAIKKSNSTISNNSILNLNKILSGKEAIYTFKRGTEIKVDSIGDNKSIQIFKTF